MSFKVSISIALLCLVYVVVVQSSPLSSCNCGLGTGSNVCRGRSCQPQVVRPHPLPLIDHPRPRVICKTVGGVEPLKPIGDLCSCGQTIVKPAHIPKPACTGCGGIGPIIRNGQSNLGLFGSSQINQNSQLNINLNQGESIVDNDGVNGGGYLSESSGSYLNENDGSYLNVNEGSYGNGGSYLNGNQGSYLNVNGGSYLNDNEGSYLNENGGSYLNGNGGSYLNGNGGSYLNGNGGSYLNGNGGSYLGGNGGSYQVDGLGQGQITINQNGGISEISGLELVGNVQGEITQSDPFNQIGGSNGPSSYIPADPVSQSLALQRSDVKNYVSDSKLQFGFHKLPRNVQRSTTKTSFPEGNIQRLNGPVLELKVVPDAVSVDEEAIEDLLEDEPEIEAPTHVRRISLGELGYGLEKGSSTKFINVDVEEREEKSCASEPYLYKCNDGFRGGQVVVNESPVPSQVYVSNKKSIPCAADEEQHSFGQDNLSFLQGPSYTYSSSNSNSAQSNVFLQKLGA